MRLLATLLRKAPREPLAPMPPPSRPALYPRTRPALLAVHVKRRVRA